MAVKKESKFKKLIHNFYPTYMYEKVEKIPYSLFENNNIKLILLDMDNTLIDYNKHEYSDELKKWSKEMKKKGLKLYILSNSISEKLVKKIAKGLGMKYCYGAGKPFLKGFNTIIEKEKIDKKNTVMIGDQLFTDVWGGNRFGIKTILVNPVDSNERLHTRIKRPLERLIIKHYLKRREVNS